THAIQVTLEPVVGGNWSTGWFIQDANAQTFRTKGSLANPKSASGTITSTEFSSLNPFTIDARGRVTTTGSFSVEVSGCKGAHAHTISINFVGQITKSAAAC
ncbi:MAG: GspH/FimT family protein, partial [Oceanobacter sp.]